MAELVSIGVPVFNEERFVASALDSLLGQDYPNLEILISDNGSTDGTSAICREYAQRFDHVRYHGWETNRGANANVNHVFDLASGAYFMWASGHDLWSPELVTSAVKELNSHPNSVLAFGSTKWIDAEGNAHPKETGWNDTRGMTVIERFFTVFWGNMHPIMGVIRIGALRTMLRRSGIAASDLAALLELALHGEFLHLSDVHWYRREFRGPESYRERMRRYKSAEFGLVRSPIERHFPFANLPFRLTHVVGRAPIGLRDKLLLLVMLYPTMIARYLGAPR